MRRYVPMPSPNGTNYDNLFLPARGFSRVVAAYDSKRGLDADFTTERQALARQDAMTTRDESPLAQVKEFLKGKLSRADFAKIDEIMAPNAEDDDDGPSRMLDTIKQALNSGSEPGEILSNIHDIISGAAFDDIPATPPNVLGPRGEQPQRPTGVYGQDAALRRARAHQEINRRSLGARSFAAMYPGR